MNRGQLGQKAQKLFTEALKKAARNPLLDFDRIPDARTSHGRLGKRKGDYYLFYDGTAALIEVKECKHDYRLSTKRVTQLPKLRRFDMTKNMSAVVVYHSSTKKWRVAGPMFLDEHKDKPSYDLRELDEFDSADDLINFLLTLMGIQHDQESHT